MDTRAVVQKFKDLGVEITRDDTWKVQSATCVKHSALERLAAKLGIEFDAPDEVVVTDTQVVVRVTGRFRDDKNVMRSAWSYGEVNMGGSNPNYRVSGKASAYPFAMSEKRGKDRVIIKLAGLHGVHSEEELRGQDPEQDQRRDQDQDDDRQTMSVGASQDSLGNSHEVSDLDGKAGNVVPMRGRSKPEQQEQKLDQQPGGIDAEMEQVDALKKRIDALTTSAEIKTFMQGDAKADLARLSEAAADEVVAYGRKLHKSLSTKEKAKETA